MKSLLARVPLRLPVSGIGGSLDPGSWLRALQARWPGLRRPSAGSQAITAMLIGERCVAARIEAVPGGRPRLAALEVGNASAPGQWKAGRLFAGSQPLLVLRCTERQLLTVDQPEVPDNEQALAVRWPLAEAMECDADALLATALPLTRMNDALRGPMLAVGARVDAVRAQVDTLARAGIAVRSIDIIDSALRGMALLQPADEPQARNGVMLASVGSEICIGLLQDARFCALRTLPLPAGSPRDAAGFEEHLALHIQRTTDHFERQATSLAIRQVLALLPAIDGPHRDDVRSMLPLAARWFEPETAFDVAPAASARLREGDVDDGIALACVAAARLLGSQA